MGLVTKALCLAVETLRRINHRFFKAVLLCLWKNPCVMYGHCDGGLHPKFWNAIRLVPFLPAFAFLKSSINDGEPLSTTPVLWIQEVKQIVNVQFIRNLSFIHTSERNTGITSSRFCYYKKGKMRIALLQDKLLHDSSKKNITKHSATGSAVCEEG